MEDYNNKFDKYMEYKNFFDKVYLIKYNNDFYNLLSDSITELNSADNDIKKYFVLEGKGVDNGQVKAVINVLKQYLNDLNNKYYTEAKRLMDKAEKIKNDALVVKNESYKIMNDSYIKNDKNYYYEAMREASINQGLAANRETYG